MPLAIQNEFRALSKPDPVPGALWIPLRNRHSKVTACALIDREDAELAAVTWHRNNEGYAVRCKWQNGHVATVYLHRVILGAPPGVEVDHVNRDRLDNRRCNLRLATRSQNARNSKRNKRNTSGFKGVRFDGRAAGWRAGVGFEGKLYPLGLFDTPEEAAFAYDFAATALHGEFAATNFELSDSTRDRAIEFGVFLLRTRRGESAGATR
jgi:hypothetical protein